jgi:hypothetical protein
MTAPHFRSTAVAHAGSRHTPCPTRASCLRDSLRSGMSTSVLMRGTIEGTVGCVSLPCGR